MRLLFGADVVLQLFERVEFAYVLGELIVEFRQLLHAYIVNFAAEDRFFSREIFRVIIFGERNAHVDLVTGLCPDQLLFESGNKAARSQHERLVFGGAALELVFPDEPCVIQLDGVSVFGFPLDDDEAGVALLERLQLDRDIFFFGLVYHFYGLDALVVFNRHFGGDGYGYVDAECLPRFERFLSKVHARPVHGLQIQGLDRFRVTGAKQFVDRVFEKYIFSIPGFDDRSRSLPFAKSVDCEFTALGLICLLQGFFEILCRKRHGERRFVSFFLNQIRCHECFLLSC